MLKTTGGNRAEGGARRRASVYRALEPRGRRPERRGAPDQRRLRSARECIGPTAVGQGLMLEAMSREGHCCHGAFAPPAR